MNKKLQVLCFSALVLVLSIGLASNAKASSPVWQSDLEGITNLNQLGIPYYVKTNFGIADSVTLVSSTAHSGSQALQIKASSTRCELDLFPSHSDVTSDFLFDMWIYIPSNTITYGQWFTIFQLEGSILPNYEPIFGAMIYTQEMGNDFVIGGRDNNGNKIQGGSGLPAGILADGHMGFPRDQWVHFEWYTHIAASGQIAAWINGAKVCTANCDTSGLALTTMFFSPMIYGSSGTIYVDDMTLYNAPKTTINPNPNPDPDPNPLASIFNSQTIILVAVVALVVILAKR